jgi:hypothetical protein
VRARLKAALYAVCPRAISGKRRSLDASQTPIASRRFDELQSHQVRIVAGSTTRRVVPARAHFWHDVAATRVEKTNGPNITFSCLMLRSLSIERDD